jgi:hypothetical protein
MAFTLSEPAQSLETRIWGGNAEVRIDRVELLCLALAE